MVTFVDMTVFIIIVMIISMGVVIAMILDNALVIVIIISMISNSKWL